MEKPHIPWKVNMNISFIPYTYTHTHKESRAWAGNPALIPPKIILFKELGLVRLLAPFTNIPRGQH